MTYLKDFRAQIAHRDYLAFFRLWEEYCVGDEVDPEELKHILLEVKRSEFAELFGKHVEKILPLWEKLQEGEIKDEIFKWIIDLQTTQHVTLYELVLDFLERKYGNDKNFKEKIHLIGLRNRDRFQGVISRFELLDHMKKGNFVFHAGSWGIGEIVDVSTLREQLTVEFELISGKRDISFINAFNTLTPISHTHFLTRRFRDFERLEQEAREDPLAVIHSLLRDLGPKTAADIKNEVCEWIIPQKEWSKWWQNVRAKLKKDSKVDLQNPLLFSFKENQISHEELLRKRLEEKMETSQFILILHNFFRDFPETLKNSLFKKFLQNKVEEEIKNSSSNEAHLLQLHFFLEELSEEKGYAIAQKIVKDSQQIDLLVHSVEIVAFKKRIFVMLRKLREDWKESFLDLLLKVEQNLIRSYLFNELLKTEVNLKGRIEELLTKFFLYPKAFVWYFQEIMYRNEIPFSDLEGKSRFFETFFLLLNDIEGLSHQRTLVKKMHTILTKDRYAVVRILMRDMGIEAIQELLLLASKCNSFSDHDMKIFYSLAEVVHPSLTKTRKKQENLSENCIIWMTEKGYTKIKDRIERIGTVETIKTSEEIMEARSHGDISESPAFMAALEKQKQLQTELKMLSSQLSLARIISKVDVNTDEVGVGCTVKCRNNQGETKVYTLLGPWDADPEKGILSLQSKLAQEMEGLNVNDTFSFQGEEFVITKITNYLENE